MVQRDQKEKKIKRREKEQVSDVENPPVVENLTLVGNLTVVENFQGLRLWKRPLEEISSLFLCRGRQSSHHETHLFLLINLHSLPSMYNPRISHLYNS